MATEEMQTTKAPDTGSTGNEETPHHERGRRSSLHFKEYKFFRSFSAKVENWPMRKAEALWRRMRERKIAGLLLFLNFLFLFVLLMFKLTG